MIQSRHVRVRTVLSSRVAGLLLSLAIVLGGVAAALAETPGDFINTGAMATPRSNFTATLLNNGKVLVVGGFNDTGTLKSAELYDPATGLFSPTGSMAMARANHTATLLPNGKVLIAGGEDNTGNPAIPTAELYDPAGAGTFSFTGNACPVDPDHPLPPGALCMTTPRTNHTATLLNTGQVLVTGGQDLTLNALDSAELYDPGTQTFTAITCPNPTPPPPTTTHCMAAARQSHTATLLNTGQVLLVAGLGADSSPLPTAELYNPATGLFTASAGVMAAGRTHHTATLLNTGQVLVAGGYDNPGTLATAELYNPITDLFSAPIAMTTARAVHTATLLHSGKVLITGGIGNALTFLASAELFDPFTAVFTATGSMATARSYHAAALLPNRKVLVAGGWSCGFTGCHYLASAELYTALVDHDFNGDSKSDILWRNLNPTSTDSGSNCLSPAQSPPGALCIWLMNGLNISSPPGSPGGLSLIDWSIVGVGDFNGDGKADILWFNNTTGNLLIWFMNGKVKIGQGAITGPGPGWTVAGVADFNGDGKADILWRHTSGLVFIWLIDGTTSPPSVIGAGSIGNPGTDWTIVGEGDFNGDGNADILWRHTSGLVYIWLIDGFNVVGSGSLGNPGTDWHINGVGDFNGDGNADILWRHDTGVVYIWFMNGTSVSGQGPVGSADPIVWSIVRTGDFNGDGDSDILWRNTSGGLFIWLLNGTAVIGAGSPGGLINDWQIQ